MLVNKLLCKSMLAFTSKCECIDKFLCVTWKIYTNNRMQEIGSNIYICFDI